jgi:hypothetical protein
MGEKYGMKTEGKQDIEEEGKDRKRKLFLEFYFYVCNHQEL